MAKTSRRIDELGRVVIPVHIRKALNLTTNNRVELSLDDDGKIVIQATEERCSLCGKTLKDGVKTVSVTANRQNKLICCNCAVKVAQVMEEVGCNGND